MGSDRDWPRGKVLPADGKRPHSTQDRNRKLGAAVGSGGDDSAKPNWRTLMNWFQRLSRTGRMEKELDAELRFHFETLVAAKVEAGLTEGEARRAARLEFGGHEQVKEDCRQSRGTLWV